MSSLLKYILLLFLGYQMIQFLFSKKKPSPPLPKQPPTPENSALNNINQEGEYIEYEEIKE